MVYTTEGFLGVAIESWPKWDLNPDALTDWAIRLSVQNMLLQNNKNAQNDGKRTQPLNSFLKLYLSPKMLTGFTTDVRWRNKKMCSVTSESSQSSNRPIS